MLNAASLPAVLQRFFRLNERGTSVDPGGPRRTRHVRDDGLHRGAQPADPRQPRPRRARRRSATCSATILSVPQVAAVTALVAGVMTIALRPRRQLPVRDGDRPRHQHAGRGDDRPAGDLARGDGPRRGRRCDHRDPRRSPGSARRCSTPSPTRSRSRSRRGSARSSRSSGSSTPGSCAACRTRPTPPCPSASASRARSPPGRRRCSCVGLLLTGVLVARGVRAGILHRRARHDRARDRRRGHRRTSARRNGTNPKGWNLGYPALPESIVCAARPLARRRRLASARSPGCPRWRSRCWCSRSCSPTSSTRWAR